jgi:hypothetical protein
MNFIKTTKNLATLGLCALVVATKTAKITSARTDKHFSPSNLRGMAQQQERPQQQPLFLPDESLDDYDNATDWSDGNATFLSNGHLPQRRALLQQISFIIPSELGFFGGNGGKVFSHDAALTAGKIVKIEVYSGSVIDGINMIYENGRSFFAGKKGGSKSEFSLRSNEHIIRVQGRAGSKVDFLRFQTSDGRSFQAGGGGGTPFGSNFPAGTALQFLRGRAGRLIDAIAFAVAPIPAPLEKEITNRVGPSFGGNGGQGFSDFDTFFNDGIIKIQKIIVHHGSRVDGLEIEYLTENGKKTKLHGTRGGRPSTVNFNDAALKDIILRTGRRVDSVGFVDTKGRSFGPFGGNGGKPQALRSKNGEAIISLFGREANEIDRLGAVFQSGAIERVEITGSFAFSPISQDVNTLNFDGVRASNLVLVNCDADSTTPVTGVILFEESVTTTESFSLATTQQANFETTVTAGVEAGVGAVVSASVSVTVGASFSKTEEFGTEFSQTQTFGFNSGISAQPGTIVNAAAVYSEVKYAFAFTVPVNVFFVADPKTAVPDVFEGVMEGVTATEARVEQTVEPCL